MLMRTWSNRSSHSLLVGVQHSAATWEDSFVISYKWKHTLTVGSSNQVPWCLPLKDLYWHKYRHIDSQSSFIHNCQNLEATKVSIILVNKLWYIQTMKYLLFSPKMKWATEPQKKIEEPYLPICKWKVMRSLQYYV